MSVILEVIAPRVLAPALAIGVALIVKGYADVGDGFSAGVIVGLAVGLSYITLGPERTERRFPLLRRAPAGIVVGLLLALADAFFAVLGGEPPLTHEPGPGAGVVTFGHLELLTAVLFDVGVFLIVASGLVVVLHHLSSLVQAQEEGGAQEEGA